MSDRPPILMQRRGAFLAPYAAADGEAIERFPGQKVLKVRVSQPRSLPQHRLYFGLLDKVAENLDQDVTGDDLHEWVKLKLGYVTPIRLRTGEIVEVPKSIAFDKMPQDEFQRFFNDAKTLVIEGFLPRINRAALDREVREMVGQAA